MTSLVVLAFVTATWSADLYVDPQKGDDANDGVGRPVKTLATAIRLAAPGDTIHLPEKETILDWAAFYDKSGEPGRPITLDGHGSTLDGCDPLPLDGWVDEGDGLWRHDDLMPLTDAIIDRWFFVFAGVMNRMRRCSKGPSEPLPIPTALKPGEWTFVKDEARTAKVRAGYIQGAFFIRLGKGATLASAKLEYPSRPAGVMMHGKCRHLVVCNLTSTRPYNDGFNLSDCQDVRLENIRAVDCGDDGISAHGACRYAVERFASIGNATGICDTGDSETTYKNVLIERCVGFDLFFLDTGRYQVSDAWIRSSAAQPLYLQGQDKPAAPCRVWLNNVRIERLVSGGEIRVNPNCHLEAERCTFEGLELRTVAGDAHFARCRFDGTSGDGYGADLARLPKVKGATP